jgi:hypothetical protein
VNIEAFANVDGLKGLDMQKGTCLRRSREFVFSLGEERRRAVDRLAELRNRGIISMLLDDPFGQNVAGFRGR